MVARHMAVTLGDPAGIGPEVTQAALKKWLPAHPHTHVTVIGPAGMADAIAQDAGSQVQALTQAPFGGPMGQPSAASGQAAWAALDAGITLAERAEVDALVTAPLSKQALHLAGYPERGHTDILARRLASGPVAMAFFTPQLRVVLATAHMPLRQVCLDLTPRMVLRAAQLLHASLQIWFGIPSPRLALAGLNPHAGEGGILGCEEHGILKPAVQAAQAQNIDLSDPLAPDTVFRQAWEGAFDGVVALYHDQGLIPIKLLDFGTAVHTTLGLKVVRTSPDHGTAYDRVGTHTAQCEGMLSALQAAARWGGQPMVRVSPSGPPL